MSNVTSQGTATIRGILTLSSGTAVTRVLAASGQLVLAFWLSPTEFGYWAAASSALGLLTGLRNFGEVNGYLSGRGARLATVIWITRRLNLLLVLAGLMVAALYFMSGSWQIALLAALISLTLPVQGDSDVMYAAAVKAKKHSWIVIAQSISAFVKIITGIIIAILSGSAISIAISVFAFSLVLDILLMFGIRSFRKEDVSQDVHVAMSTRSKWAVNSVMMSFPLQAGFLVAQFIADPALLGVFFFSFQVTLGVSGLISLPLARASLSAFADTPDKQRGELALRLCHFFGAGVLVLVALMSLLAPLVGDSVSDQWSAAAPSIVLLLATLPTRMLAPVLDAYQQAGNKWWQSTTFNFVDALGTALAALTALTGNILVLVLSLSLWKFLLNSVRMLFILGGTPLSTRLLLLIPLALSAGLIFLGAFSSGIFEYLWPFLAVVLGGVWFFTLWVVSVLTRKVGDAVG